MNYLTDGNACNFRHDGKTAKTMCGLQATHRNELGIVRCHLHGGHHDYDEKWDGQQWRSLSATGQAGK
jgi:hypothetical protein